VPLRLPKLLAVSAALTYAVLAAACAVLAAACDEASSDAVDGESPRVTFEDGLPVVASVRVVCRLASDTPSAIAANITGADGSQSVVAGAEGTSYWFFGDTVRKTAERQDVIPAAVATTSDTNGADCIDLEFKTTTDGVVTAMFPRREETTAWPDGVFAVQDGTIYFYMVKAFRQSPFAWHVKSVGLGRIPPGSLDGERLVETIWDENSGFGARVAGARSPVAYGNDVLVYLALEDRRSVVAKAPLDRIAESAAYTYWDGGAWSSDPAEAAALWESPETGFPPDNGVQVSFDDRVGRWIALYNDSMASTKVRLAEEPWGPWSEPVAWFDCQPLVQDTYPYCYTGELHRQLTAHDGNTQYMTIASQKPYDVSLVELHMASPIHEWRDEDGARRYAAASPGAGYEDAGVAFYASTKPAPGLVPIYEQRDGDRHRYDANERDDDSEPAFYARLDDAGAVPVAAVRALDGALSPGGSEGEAVFFVPCPVPACEESLPAE
jgi:hypothetical protein